MGHGRFGEGSDFFSELRRRKVYRAGATYVAAAFAILEGASLVFPTLGLGAGAYNGLVVVSLLGFPLALGLAWAFELTDGGVRRTAAAPDAGAPAPDRWGRVKAAVVGAGFVAVVWVGAALWQSPAGETGAVPVDPPVLAVLPFADRSPDGDQAYFADGLHDELLNQLGVLPGIGLISGTSVAHFRGSPATLGAIADSLGARYVLEGSVRHAVDSVQVTVRLVDATFDEELWSESYGAGLSLEGLFGLQTDLATRVARSLGATLSARVGRVLENAPTNSLEAYNAYLQGLHHWSRYDVGGMQKAADDLERAVALDPEFGRAHGQLALVYAVLNNVAGRTQGELFPQIREHAEAAERYAPDDPVAHMAMMTVHWSIDQDWQAARREMEDALAISPDYVEALYSLAEWYGVVAGETERGLELVDHAIRLDLFSVYPRLERAWILTNGQRYAEAAKEYRRLVDMAPEETAHALNLASNLALAGRQEEALRQIRDVWPALPTPHRATLAAHLARAGDTTAAREILEQAVARKAAGGSVSASGVAAGYAALGDTAQALIWLERSFDEEGGVYALRHPDWILLRGSPRFGALWRRAGLPGDPPPASLPAL